MAKKFYKYAATTALAIGVITFFLAGSVVSARSTSQATPQPATVALAEAGTPAPTPDASSTNVTSTQLENSLRNKTVYIPQSADTTTSEAMGKAKQIRSKLAQQSSVKLDDTRLKICQSREAGIDKIMDRINNRAQIQFDFYDQTVSHAQAYVAGKKLTIPQYDQLLSDTAAKKSASQTAIAKLVSDKAIFKCDGSNPAVTSQLFKADGEVLTRSLKSYQIAVKAMLTAIRAAASPAATNGGAQ